MAHNAPFYYYAGSLLRYLVALGLSRRWLASRVVFEVFERRKRIAFTRRRSAGQL